MIGFGKRDYLGNGEHIMCAGKNLGTRQAVFFKLTTAPIAIRMSRPKLGRIGGRGHSFKAVLGHRHIVQREHKQEERNELDPAGH